MTDGRATSNRVSECHCFQYQTWCDCVAGRKIEAERLRVAATGSRAEYVAFLRGESDFWRATQ